MKGGTLVIRTILFILLNCFFLSSRASHYLSPLDLAFFDNNHKILVSDYTGKQLLVFDVTTNKVIKSIPLPDRPSGICASLNSNGFYITTGESTGTIYKVDIDKEKVKKLISVGFGLNSPILSQDESKLYVCSRFDNTVKVIDIQKAKLIKSIPTTREPISAEITPDGKRLFVANHMPQGRADVDYIASKLTVIDLENEALIKHIDLVNGAEGMRDICISPDGKYVYASHLMARYQIPTNQIERGWINTNAMSVVRVADSKLLYTVLLDDIGLGFANPWAIKASKDGKRLVVSSAGNNELRVIDLPALNKKIEEEISRSENEDIQVHLNAHNDLSFISDVSYRVPLTALGTRSILLKGDTVITGDYYSESLSFVVLNDRNQHSEIQSYTLGTPKELSAERQGEIYFNDASLCFQKWQSCASCHSNDGRMDALNWDLLNDGIGNPKNVKSLLYAHQTAPSMALGIRENAETAVRAGIRHIQFAVRPDEDADAIDAFLKSLREVDSPKLVNGKLSKSAKRGKKVFAKAGCVSCHPAPYYTNCKSYDLGTGKYQDEGKKFDTPSLIEVWRTSPYWHDGRAESILDVLEIHFKHNQHLNPISDNEMIDLIEYVESL